MARPRGKKRQVASADPTGERERDLIRKRTRAGLKAARARGRRGGRPSVMSAEKVEAARRMYESREHTVAAIAATSA